VVDGRRSIKISDLNYRRLRELQRRLRYPSVDKLLDDLLTLAEDIMAGRRPIPRILDLYPRLEGEKDG